jgi:hypothetical protein
MSKCLLGQAQLGEICADRGERGDDLARRYQQIRLIGSGGAVLQQRGSWIAASIHLDGVKRDAGSLDVIAGELLAPVDLGVVVGSHLC